MTTVGTKAEYSPEEYIVEGMTCASCVRRVEKAALKVPGIEHAQVNLATSKLSIFGERPDLELLEQSVTKAGYTLRPLQLKETSESLYPLKASLLALLLSLTTVALALYTAFALPEDAAVVPVLNVLSLILTLGTAVLARRIYFGAWTRLRAKTLDMNSLVALGTLSAFGYSLVLLSQDLGNMHYLDTGALILAFVLLGKSFEERARTQALSSFKDLLQDEDKDALLERADGPELVPLTAIQVGDILRVLPGEKILADARVVQGDSSISEAMLTGEALPRSVKPQDILLAGSINIDSLLLAEVTALPKDSFLARIKEQIERAQSSKASIERVVDKVSSVFLPLVLLLAFSALLTHSLLTSFSTGLIAFVAVLVVACPCALGLATPAALMVGLGHAARKGILFKDPTTIERLLKFSTIVFDKTGTLTEGKFRVTSYRTQEVATSTKEAPKIDSKLHNSLLASGAQSSTHPLSKALLAHLEEQGTTLLPVASSTNYPGQGLHASIEGSDVYLGSKAFVKAQLESNVAALSTLEELNSLGPSALVYTLIVEPISNTTAFSEVQLTLGLFELQDTPRTEARSVIELLQAKNKNVVLLSGDNTPAVEHLAKELGIKHAYAEQTPQDKLTHIKALQKELGGVAMVGDGINDAPALAQADLAIAVQAGSSLALEAGDIVLLRPGLTPLTDSLIIAQRIQRTIRQNLAWAFLYNLLLLPLAALTLLTPELAALAMGLSSVSVVLNSSRLLRIKY